ncbi:MAG TPA: pectate lyase, partial [Verrucomicrobiae bacterium]|nr:pectate lyase [Verrucomicrobiae bacterium]
AKAVIAATEQGNDLSHTGWAYVCAGGSLPNLRNGADAALLAAIPHMKPWLADTSKRTWAIREADKQMLVYAAGSGDVSLDLSGDPGNFKVQMISDDGEVTTGGASVAGGSTVTLPKQSGRRVYWLTKE